MVVSRSRTEIIIQILQTVNDNSGGNTDGGATKTKIMYKSFLNYIELKEYLSLLVEGDFVQYHKASATFTITEKGRRFLNIFERTEKDMNPIEASIF